MIQLSNKTIECQLKIIYGETTEYNIKSIEKLGAEIVSIFCNLSPEQVDSLYELINNYFTTADEKDAQELITAIKSLFPKPEVKKIDKKDTVEILICANPDCQYPKLTRAMKYCPRCRQEVNTEPEDIDQDDEEIVLLKCECGEILELDWEVCPYCCKSADKAKRVREKKGLIGKLQTFINLGNPVYEEVNVVKKNGEEDSEKVEEEPEVEELNADIDMENIITESEKEPLEHDHACNCFTGRVIEIIKDEIENLQTSIIENLKNSVLENLKNILSPKLDKINNNLDILRDSIVESAKLSAGYEAELSGIKDICNNLKTDLNDIKNTSNISLKETRVIRDDQQKAASCFQALADHVVKKSHISSPEKKKKSTTEN